MDEKTDLNTRNDELIFAAEEKDELKINGFWKVLIVDDDEEIHNISKLVLEDIVFEGKRIQFLSAFNGAEAKKIIRNDPEIALILLDVVMEEEDTGLKIVKFIRNEIMNRDVRIILRTGYPGHAPEKKIIVDFDINDYKEKTELSSQKLITSVISALRSYKDIVTIIELNKNLEKKVEERTAELKNVNEKLSASLAMIKKDLEAGRKIQFKLLPDLNRNTGEYDFTSFLKPSLYLSGDFLDFFELDENLICFYFADVSGHGAASAFVTVFLKRFVDTYVEKFKEKGDGTILSPSLLLENLNKELLSENLEKFLTIFIGIIDKEKNKLTYINAGQFPYPVLHSAEGNRLLETASSPVGMFSFSNYADCEIILPREFLIFCSSDGFLEILTEENLKEKQVIINNLINNLDFHLDSLIEKFRINSLNEVPDDITFLLIKKINKYE